MAEVLLAEGTVEVSGAAILATVAGMESDIEGLLEAYGIDDLSADGWYPQQAWLDVLNTIGDTNAGYAMLDLVSIGMRIPENALWPPNVTDVVTALESIDVAYHMNHRGGDIGSYRAERVGPNAVDVYCDNPYPSDFDYGIIYATVKQWLEPGMGFAVLREASPSRLRGDDTCIYRVRWG